MSTWGVAECGTVAASWGMELMSGSGVLLGGEMASGVITMRDFSCRWGHTGGCLVRPVPPAEPVMAMETARVGIKGWTLRLGD